MWGSWQRDDSDQPVLLKHCLPAFFSCVQQNIIVKMEPVSDQQLKSVTIQHQRTTDDNIYHMEIFEARWMNKSV